MANLQNQVFNIMIMNLKNGSDDKKKKEPAAKENKKPAAEKEKNERRIEAIEKVITDHKPDVLFCQEYRWIEFKHLPNNIPIIKDEYDFKGNVEACFLFKKDLAEIVEIVEISGPELLYRMHRDHRPFMEEKGFYDVWKGSFWCTCIPRMCVVRVKTAKAHFICISWHGRHSSTTDTMKVDLFDKLIKFILKIHESHNLPIVLAGDFNVTVSNVRHLVKDPLVLHEYTPLRRSEPDRLIDYFITTKDFTLRDTECIDLGKDNDLFDHDPVKTCLTAPPVHELIKKESEEQKEDLNNQIKVLQEKLDQLKI